jgi:two-component system, NarL family, sensor kinase
MAMSGSGAHSGRSRSRRAPSGPSDRALHRFVGWYAVGLRLWIAVAVVVAAPLAATAATSAAWLAAVLVTLCAWSVFFAVWVGRRGLSGAVVLADAAVIVAMIVVHHLVVPAALISAGTTWMLPLASTAIYISQFAFPPQAGLPVAALVTAVYATTVPHPAGALYLVIQALATAALMALVRRGGRNADAAIGRQLRLEQELTVEAARRADQREQNRRLHDTVLATLTMVASGALDTPSPVLAAQASRDLRVLHTLPALPRAGAPAGLPLADRLAAVAAEAAPLQVSASFFSATKQLPPTAVDRFTDCAAEALRNVARHAGTGTAEIRVSDEDGQVVVEIIDQGCGFDAGSVPRSRRGISESIRGRMAEIGGTAEISGGPGAGTAVTLRWPGMGTAGARRWPGEDSAITSPSGEAAAAAPPWPGDGTVTTPRWPG